MRSVTLVCLSLLFASTAAPPALAQSGQQTLVGRAGDAIKKFDLMTFTQEEEEQLGAKISELLRQRYGVHQEKDPVVHKYVTLLGKVLAESSSRPSLKWTFIVLDTDGVNAFAAPGGYVHITKGALALIENESEMACVLGHEVGHVAEKHTLRALQKAVGMQEALKVTGQDRLNMVAQAAYTAILENQWSQGDETEADRVGVTVANKAGYQAGGLSAFLMRLAEQRKDAKEPSGLFSKYEDTQTRVKTMNTLTVPPAFTATASLRERYQASIPFKPVPMARLDPLAGSGTATGTPAAPQPQEKKSRWGALRDRATSVGRTVTGQSESTTQVSLAGAKGVNPDRDAKGGPVAAVVVVQVTQAELEEFRKPLRTK